MRNNEDRLGTKSIDGDAPPQTKGAQAGASFSFSTPTEFVELPSAGRYYPEGHPLCGKEEVEIYHMTAKDEDILTSETLIKKGIVIDRLLQNVLVDKSIDPNSLLIGDKNALLVAVRITGYGAPYDTKMICPSCTKSVAQRFDLALRTTYHATDEEVKEHGFDISSNGRFELTMPSSKIVVGVRLMNGHDEDKLNKISENRRKNKLPESTLTDQLRRMIVSVNGDSSSQMIKEYVEHMPARDSRYLRTTYHKVVPDINMAQEFSCASCGHTQELEVPFTVDFFWPQQ